MSTKLPRKRIVDSFSVLTLVTRSREVLKFRLLLLDCTQGKHVLGSLYDAKEAAVSAGKPDGEWNVMTLTCKGPSIKATVNGQTTVDVNIDQWTEPKKNPDGTKNKFKTPLKDMPRVGHLGLQYHGQPVWFRKFEIKSLN